MSTVILLAPSDEASGAASPPASEAGVLGSPLAAGVPLLLEQAVRELAEAGVPRIDVVCPGFAADCLETIEEIDDELRREYLAAFRDDAGAEFHYIAALNDSPEAVKAYASIVRREAAGWI